MDRRIVVITLGGLLVWSALMAAAWAADLKAIHTQKTKDAVVRLLSESGQWTKGKNSFVLEFKSTATDQPLDVGQVSLGTSMPMPGMAPMIAGAKLSPDKTPGRYLGEISFPDSGARQVIVTWDGRAGKGSTKFSVPVR